MTDLPPIPSGAIQDPPFTDEELEAQLAVLFPDEPGPTQDPEVVPFHRWVPTDERGAEWAMRKLAEATSEIERHQLHLQGWVEEMQEWYARATRGAERVRSTMEAKLIQYALQEREEFGRATIQLPSGVAKTTKTGGTAKIEDPESVAAFLRENLEPEVLETVVPTQPPKVMAREFGKVSKIVETEVEVRSCATCGALPLTGPECDCPLGPTWETQTRTERIVVLAETGFPVPGTSVVPEGYSPKATPGAVR